MIYPSSGGQDRLIPDIGLEIRCKKQLHRSEDPKEYEEKDLQVKAGVRLEQDEKTKKTKVVQGDQEVGGRNGWNEHAPRVAQKRKMKLSYKYDTINQCSYSSNRV